MFNLARSGIDPQWLFQPEIVHRMNQAIGQMPENYVMPQAEYDDWVSRGST